MNLRAQRDGARVTVQAVAEDGGDADHVVGFVVQRVAAGEAEIEWIEVDAGQRRRGFGRALLQEAMRLAVTAGARVMYLEVRESNVAAQGLYRALGFEPYHRREAYYTAPAEAALLWRKELPAA